MPVSHFENKAQMKFDMNYIIDSSPTNNRKSDLVTLEKLNKEKLNKKIVESERKTTYDEYLAKTTKNDDSFYDWSRTNKEYIKDPLKKISK